MLKLFKGNNRAIESPLTFLCGHLVQVLQQQSPCLHVSSQGEDVSQQRRGVRVAFITQALPQARHAFVYLWIL